jgi:hypothetical protein
MEDLAKKTVADNNRRQAALDAERARHVALAERGAAIFRSSSNIKKHTIDVVTDEVRVKPRPPAEQFFRPLQQGDR